MSKLGVDHFPNYRSVDIFIKIRQESKNKSVINLVLYVFNHLIVD